MAVFSACVAHDKAIEIKGEVGKMHGARASLLRALGREDEALAADVKAAELEAKKSQAAPLT